MCNQKLLGIHNLPPCFFGGGEMIFVLYERFQPVVRHSPAHLWQISGAFFQWNAGRALRVKLWRWEVFLLTQRWYGLIYPHLEDHPRTCKWLGSPLFLGHETPIWKGSHTPILRGRFQCHWWVLILHQLIGGQALQCPCGSFVVTLSERQKRTAQQQRLWQSLAQDV